MKLFTKSTNSKVIEAVKYAEDYFNSTCFVRDISSIEKFESTDVTPTQICELFAKFSGKNKPVEIKVTNFGWIRRRVLGRTLGDGVAYLNSYNIDRQLWDLGQTVVHEVSHIVDHHYPQARFGHGTNSSKGKELTFPYFIGEKAENWIKIEVLKKEVNRLTIKKVVLREVFAC